MDDWTPNKAAFALACPRCLARTSLATRTGSLTGERRVLVVDDALIERAVEAGERVHMARTWQETSVYDIVTAALAEVEADIRASALRDAADRMAARGLETSTEVAVVKWLRASADVEEQEGKA